MSNIIAVKVNGRTANAVKVQEILTKYGCHIKTRVGFHEVSDDECSMDGILIVQLMGEEKGIQDMFEALNNLDGVTPKKIEF